MPKNALFTIQHASKDIKKDAAAAFKSIAQQAQNVAIFDLILQQMLTSTNFQTGLASAINDPKNIEFKLALAEFLQTYFNLTPTTPIEPIE